MHKAVPDATILTIVLCTAIMLGLGGLIIAFLFAYQRKSYNHQQEILVLNENFQKTLLISRLEIQEQTLDHIAKELHANIGQLVSVVNINLGTYIKQAGSSADENILESKALVKQLMGEVKALSVRLNTEHIAKVGFDRMLRNELERLRKTGRYSISMTEEGQPYRLGAETEIILFRLCQEIINNILKHAAAKTIEVCLQYTQSQLQLEISDDGEGFDLARAEQKAREKNSTGLINIHSRSKQIGATVIISSTPGAGTHIRVTIPYDLKADQSTDQDRSGR